jgi:hypothetical protein
LTMVILTILTTDFQINTKILKREKLYRYVRLLID